jgi:plastocyanin
MPGTKKTKKKPSTTNVAMFRHFLGRGSSTARNSTRPNTPDPTGQNSFASIRGQDRSEYWEMKTDLDFTDGPLRDVAPARRIRSEHSHRPMRRVAAAAVFGVALALAACSSGASSAPSGAASSASGSTSGAASTTTIIIQNFAFHPSKDTVKPGATITVTNKDSVTHTLTSTSSPIAFNTGDISPGQTKTFTAPTKAGTYPYFCMIHQYMTGTLTVS